MPLTGQTVFFCGGTRSPTLRASPSGEVATGTQGALCATSLREGGFDGRLWVEDEVHHFWPKLSHFVTTINTFFSKQHVL